MVKNCKPHVAALRKSGEVDIVEIASEADIEDKLWTRAENMRGQMSLEMQGDIKVVRPPASYQHKKAESLSNTLALYDFAIEEADFKGWFYYVLKLYEHYEYAPIKMGCTGPNAPKNLKLTTFKYGQKLLEKYDFKGFESIEVCTTPKETSDIYLNTSSLFVHVNIATASGKGALVTCLDDEVGPFNREVFENLTRDLFLFFKPQYGIFYQREFKKGPSLYSVGIIEGLDGCKKPEDAKEEDIISEWSRAYVCSQGKYKTGDLRDIYPLNFLSQPHLDQKVGDLTLEQWILSKEAHGELKKLAENFWSWYVKPPYIPFVREALRPTGFVLCI